MWKSFAFRQISLLLNGTKHGILIMLVKNFSQENSNEKIQHIGKWEIYKKSHMRTYDYHNGIFVFWKFYTYHASYEHIWNVWRDKLSSWQLHFQPFSAEFCRKTAGMCWQESHRKSHVHSTWISKSADILYKKEEKLKCVQVVENLLI